jgi:hypothetical protein
MKIYTCPGGVVYIVVACPPATEEIGDPASVYVPRVVASYLKMKFTYQLIDTQTQTALNFYLNLGTYLIGLVTQIGHTHVLNGL